MLTVNVCVKLIWGVIDLIPANVMRITVKIEMVHSIALKVVAVS